MHIMQELHTNRPNFLFKITQDFNHTSHVAKCFKIDGKGHIMVIFDTLRNFQHGFQHALKFSTLFSTHFEIFDMVFKTVLNMVHTIGEFLCLKCVENCRVIKQGMVKVNTWVFILKRYKWHIHAGSWSLVNCWREGSTLPYKECS